VVARAGGDSDTVRRILRHAFEQNLGSASSADPRYDRCVDVLTKESLQESIRATALRQAVSV